MSTDLATTYEDLYATVLVPLASSLQVHLSHLLSQVERIDSVRARAKAPDSFIKKAFKEEGGIRKYSNPLYEIQDQVGARVIVFYLSDVKIVREKLKEFLVAIESLEKTPEKDSEFGYIGEHFTFVMPEDIVPEAHEDCAPKFFELQIKTLFQHAWSEASHDIAYKAPRKLTRIENRQMAFSAAQSWGADQIFEQLSKSIIANDDDSIAPDDGLNGE